MIERLHPGVHVTETAFSAHAIDGVSTATAQPDWTARNTHDPGVTLLELSAWLPQSLAFGLGVVHGLQVTDGACGKGITARPGHALRPDGSSIDP